MLKLYAKQTDTDGLDNRVGYFPIDESILPFTPQLVKLVEESLVRTPTATHAWVAHDGYGRIAGFTVEPCWEEECKNPGWELSFRNDEGFPYRKAGDCDSDLLI